MINTNTNRWVSVRLLFDKHIIGGNRKSNYQWQQSPAVEEEVEPLQRRRGCRSHRGTTAHFFHAGLTGALNGTLNGRQVESG